jgi:PKD repeat protein
MLKRFAVTTMALAWGGMLLASCSERPTASLVAPGPTAEIVISGVGLVVFAGYDAYPYTTVQIELTGSVEVPDGATIESWQWAVESSPELSDWSLTDDIYQTAFFTAHDPGEYILSLTACVRLADETQLCGWDELLVWAEDNQRPVADAQAYPTEAVLGEEVCFYSGGSYDPDGTLLSVDWKFGDGATSTDWYPCHTYTSVGEYTATLTVTDDWNLTGTAEVTITVRKPSPRIAIHALIDEVEGLAAQGTLDPDRAAGLIDKLSGASASLESGLTTDACKQMSAFMKQVRASVKARKLSATAGEQLIDAAEAIQVQIGCS